MKLSHIIEKVFFTPWLITAGGFKSIQMLVESKLASSIDLTDLTRVKTAHPPYSNLNANDYTLTTIGTGTATGALTTIGTGTATGVLTTIGTGTATGAGLQMGAGAFDFDLAEGTNIEWKVDANGIANIPIRGVLGQRLSSLEKICGGTDYLDIEKATKEALNRGAKGMLFHMDSSGGMVRGCSDLAQHIKGIGESIPTMAYTDTRCNSAAYWLASACNQVMASRSSDIGSIGAILPWVDMTKVWEVEGLKYDPIVNAGADLKGAGAGPSLTDKQKAYLQEAVDHIGKNFQAFIKEGRKGVSPEVFRAGTYFGDQAQEVGLIDGIASYDEAYQTLLTRVKNKGERDRAPVPKQQTQGSKAMTKEELKAQHPELYESMVQENEDAARTALEAARAQERNRLSELDALAYTPECRKLVDAAKGDGRTAQAIGVEIAGLLAKDNEHLKLQVGVYRGAKSTSDVASIDPATIRDGDTNPEGALVAKLSESFRKRYARRRN